MLVDPLEMLPARDDDGQDDGPDDEPDDSADAPLEADEEWAPREAEAPMDDGLVGALDLLEVARAHGCARLRVRALVHLRRHWAEIRHAASKADGASASSETLRDAEAFCSSFV